jgi:Zinc carboxypeptidase
MNWRGAARCGAFVSLAISALSSARALGQSGSSLSPGRIDVEYTRIIKQNLDDSRMTTELVDHLPASDTVPTPLTFLGRVVGAPGELTYAKDIARYYQALADASPRARLFTIGASEEGRDVVMLAIADEETIASLDTHRNRLAALTDPRRTSDAEARDLVKAAKPVYWITGGMHSPETGGPETLIELAYRLVVDETPFVRGIRNNVITLITPVLEVDGREKQVDTYYFNKRRAPGDVKLPLVYWGRYVAHDNNRDGIGQYLKLTQAVTSTTLEWHPTVIHDLHETQSYLYISTGTGPYNEELDPIVAHEWWTLADNDVREMTRRGVPGVWTYAYYDGWMPNYMFFIAHSHNAIGRFYEVQGYGPDPYTVRPGKDAMSREWFRPIPPLPLMKWGPRNSVNIQQSALLFALHHVAEHRDTYLDNYWLKNKRSVEKGRSGPTFAWVIPAGQRRKGDAVDAVNDLRRQGLEVSVATSSFGAGALTVHAGDYVIRADQPFRTLAAMYFAIQRFPSSGTQPYDDTGWTFQLLRDITVVPVDDPVVLHSAMAPLNRVARAPGGIVDGAGPFLVVEDTADTHLATFRFRNTTVKMTAAEQDFEILTTAGPRRLGAGSLIIPNADRASLEPQLEALGLTAWALPSAPAVAAHDLDVPRVGYVHSWTRTQDEGWWRAAFDAYGVPYTYFADQKLKEGNLREKYDVIVFPNVGGAAANQVVGLPVSGSAPLPYRRTAETPNLSTLDSSNDIRGGMGPEGLQELARFVREGGTLLAEGSTAALLPAYGITPGITAEEPVAEQVHGAVLRGVFADRKSPIAYGYDKVDLPVFFNQTPVLSVDTRPHENVARPRVVMRLPSNPDEMLLSGALANSRRLVNRALVVDQALGSGHIVMYALRPFWRWQTHGAYPLVFNALMHWNDLGAGQ